MKRCINVLLTGPSLDWSGGVQNYIRQLISYADESSLRFHYVPIGKSAIDSPAWRRPFEYIASLWRFGCSLLRVRPSVVHLNPSLNWRSLPLNLVLLLVTKILSGTPTVIFFRGWRDEVAVSMVEGDPPGRLLEAVLRASDYYLVLCESFREKLIEAGLPAERIIVSSVMVPTDILGPLPSKDSRPEQAHGVLQVLFLSRLAPSKGTHALVDMVRWWRHNVPDVGVVFHIVGDGPQFDLLSNTLAAERRMGMVRMPGNVTGAEKWALYRQADVFVFPSQHDEGFPNVIVEALAAGLPLIYTPVGALESVLSPENGVRVDLHDLSGETLGSALWALFADPARRRAMARANRELARHYDVAVVAEEMQEFYVRMAEERD